MSKLLLSGSFLTLSLYAVEQQEALPNPPPQEVVERQLEDAQREFDEAKKMFNPWYAGPLLTPSAHILAPGYVNIQPYLFWTNTYAHYDQSGKSHKISTSILQPPASGFDRSDLLDGYQPERPICLE